MKLIYLACPFHHEKPWAKYLRWTLVTALGVKLIEQGNHIYSPITEAYCYNKLGLENQGWEYWKEHDLLILGKCEELWVAKFKGWEDSIGVTEEIAFAQSNNIPVVYLDIAEYLPELGDIV